MPFIISFNSLSVGASAIPPGSSTLLYLEGATVPVHTRLTKRPCCNAMGFTVWTAILSGIFLSCKISCCSAARCPVLSNKALSVIFP